MTFSLVGRDSSGALGSVICSSSPAVGARCVHLADGVGGVNSQNITDPRLGPRILEQLQAGLPADRALAAVTDTTADIAYRQLLVVDGAGAGAAFSGDRALGLFGHEVGDGVVAGGNLLSSVSIPARMVDAFHRATGDLEGRLLAAAEAAVAAGGEAGPVHSAGLSVVREAGWRVTDLRIDWTDGEPIAELAVLLDRWLPQRDDYVARGLHPAGAPSYGVPGDD